MTFRAWYDKIMSITKSDWVSDCGRVTLYCGDCLDILPQLEAGSVDAVVTDPPYGIGFNYESHDDSEEEWFILMDRVVPLCKRIAKFVIMPVCRLDRMGWWYTNHSPSWVIAWYKGSPGHRSHIGFQDWEAHLTFGKPPKPMHDYFHTRCGFEIKGHPCPKPVAWAQWLIERAVLNGGSILDPFMGSGTTGVACVKTGRRFIGIEMEPKYFEIAKRRIKEELEANLFAGASA